MRKLAATAASPWGRVPGAAAFRSVGSESPSPTLVGVASWGRDAGLVSPGKFFLHVILPLALLHLAPQIALQQSHETTSTIFLF